MEFLKLKLIDKQLELRSVIGASLLGEIERAIASNELKGTPLKKKDSKRLRSMLAAELPVDHFTRKEAHQKKLAAVRQPRGYSLPSGSSLFYHRSVCCSFSQLRAASCLCAESARASEGTGEGDTDIEGAIQED